MNTVLVTGASEGIGFELCKLLAKDGCKLVLSARNEERLKERQKFLHDTYQAHSEIIVRDLSETGASKAIVDELNARGITIDVLINNAGFGAHGRFEKVGLDVHQRMMQVNIVALTELTQLLLPGMIARKNGHIVNVASVAGFVPGPGMAVYYATKAYVVSISEALAAELEGTGVKVSVLCPGPTATEFQKRAGLSESRLFNLTKPMTAEEVARQCIDGMKSGQVTIINGALNQMMVSSVRFVPRQVVAKMVRKINGPQ